LSTVETPASIRWKEEARKGRRRLYPTTLVYTVICLGATGFALRSNARAAALFWVCGVAVWTWVEYVVHRYILHGRFPDGPGLRHVLHTLFDHLHLEHHQRPWDGEHINGRIRDTAPFLGPVVLASLLLPAHTLTAFLAGFAQAYVVEEWVHHSVHFYHFENRYFRYIKRHHMYHHSPKGSEVGFGLTSGLWDIAHGTRIPAPVRAALYAPLTGGSRFDRRTA
jgi:sterol desaturase/sphingolipid hydroxylase (fatty acid hydroxylase superfamily)